MSSAARLWVLTALLALPAAILLLWRESILATVVPFGRTRSGKRIPDPTKERERILVPAEPAGPHAHADAYPLRKGLSST